ncbi:MAG: hypothetical protein M0P99_09190, partial [Candidatus Cloacimonetes bacterium]|nr:hypothetical protein [Candidatus Cloacimonadota bacterium]
VEFALKKVLTAYSLIGAICDINYPDKATPHPNTPARQHASTPTHQYFRSNPNLFLSTLTFRLTILPS